jgi:hypothetical protein
MSNNLFDTVAHKNLNRWHSFLDQTQNQASNLFYGIMTVVETCLNNSLHGGVYSESSRSKSRKTHHLQMLNNRYIRSHRIMLRHQCLNFVKMATIEAVMLTRLPELDLMELREIFADLCDKTSSIRSCKS